MRSLQGEDLARFAKAFWFSPGVPLIVLNELAQMYRLLRIKILCQEAADGALAISTIVLQSSRSQDVADDMLRSNFLSYIVPLLKCRTIPGNARRMLLETIVTCLDTEAGDGRPLAKEQTSKTSNSRTAASPPSRGQSSLGLSCLGQLASFGLADALGECLLTTSRDNCGPLALSLVRLYVASSDCLTDAQLFEFVSAIGKAAISTLRDERATKEQYLHVREAVMAICGTDSESRDSRTSTADNHRASSRDDKSVRGRPAGRTARQSARTQSPAPEPRGSTASKDGAPSSDELTKKGPSRDAQELLKSFLRTHPVITLERALEEVERPRTELLALLTRLGLRTQRAKPHSSLL